MRIREFIVICLLTLMLCMQSLPIYAATSPAESEIFTTDANPDEITRVAFLLETSAGYYREVEGYLLPEGSSIIINEEVYERGMYIAYVHDVDLGDYYGRPFCGSYTGLVSEAYSPIADSLQGWPEGCTGENSVKVTGSESGVDAVHEIRATYNGRTEMLYFASDTVESLCYRVLTKDEKVDSRSLKTYNLEDYVLLHTEKQKYGQNYFWVNANDAINKMKPVTYILEFENYSYEVDGFIFGSGVCIDEFNIETGRPGIYTLFAINDETTYESQVKFFLDSDVFDWSEAGIFYNGEEMIALSYTERELREGEIEIVPRERIEVEPIQINPLTDIFGTSAMEDEITKVLFKIATGNEEKAYKEVEGYLIPFGEYVALDSQLFADGMYDAGYHKIREDSIVGRPWNLAFMFDEAGMFQIRECVYDIRVILASGETEIFYCAADTINPACYTVLEGSQKETEVVETEIMETEIVETTETMAGVESTTKMEETLDKTAWFRIHPEAAPLAVASAVVFAASISAIGAIFTPTVEKSAGIKAKRGILVINGDVEIPEVHYEYLDDIAIPVQVAEADDITWIFTAKTFTPGYKKLVKTIVVPTGNTSAEIKLKLAEDYANRITEDLEMYIEVAALGIDIHGERNLLEKMSEISVMRELKEEQISEEKTEETEKTEEVKEPVEKKEETAETISEDTSEENV